MPHRRDDDASIALHLRLSRRTWERYSTQAMAHSQPLSTYLRERLEREDELLAELASIRRAVQNLSPPTEMTEASTPAAITPGMVLESLLLLRALAQSQRTEMVHAEVRRLGLQVWRAPAHHRSR